MAMLTRNTPMMAVKLVFSATTELRGGSTDRRSCSPSRMRMSRISQAPRHGAWVGPNIDGWVRGTSQAAGRPAIETIW